MLISYLQVLLTVDADKLREDIPDDNVIIWTAMPAVLSVILLLGTYLVIDKFYLHPTDELNAHVEAPNNTENETNANV